MTDHEKLLRRAMRTRRLAAISRQNCNRVLIDLQFPDRPAATFAPIFLALGLGSDFSVEDFGDDDAVILPFRRAP
jgi:hypothetical protein